jgi:hypothetical protein
VDTRKTAEIPSKRAFPKPHPALQLSPQAQTEFEAIVSVIFLSHKSADKARLQALVKQLLAANHTLWIDRPHEMPFTPHPRVVGIERGLDWATEIISALSRVDWILQVWSKTVSRSEDNQWYMREGEFASQTNRKRLIHIDSIIEMEPLHMVDRERLSQSLDMTPPNFTRNISSLLSDLKLPPLFAPHDASRLLNFSVADRAGRI